MLNPSRVSGTSLEGMRGSSRVILLGPRGSAGGLATLTWAMDGEPSGVEAIPSSDEPPVKKKRPSIKTKRPFPCQIPGFGESTKFLKRHIFKEHAPGIFDESIPYVGNIYPNHRTIFRRFSLRFLYIVFDRGLRRMCLQLKRTSYEFLLWPASTF